MRIEFRSSRSLIAVAAIAVFAGLLGLSRAPALAQTNDRETASPSPSPSPSATPLPVIGNVRVATGSEQNLHALPFAASVLDIEAIRANPALTGDALLRALPGFDRDRSNSAFTNYGQLRVSFSGAGNDRGLVLADGLPAQDGFGGQVDWAAYPGADISRAELLRGAGSALYGAGAIGGVLALDTFAPESTGGITGNISLAAGTHDSSTYYAAIRVPIAENLQASFSAEHQHLSYDDLAPGYTFAGDTSTVSSESMASLKLRYTAAPDAVFSYGYRGAWDYQQEGRPNYDFWRRLEQHDVRYLRHHERSNFSLDYMLRTAFVTNRADLTPAFPGKLRYTQYVPTAESAASASWTVTSTSSAFALRADGRIIRGSSTQFGPSNLFQNSGSGTQQIGGVAVQERIDRSRFNVVGGIRFDAEAFSNAGGAGRQNAAASPRIAVHYDVNDHLALRISDGSGIRFPFLNELVRSYVIGAMSYVANPSLVPERSSSLTGGADWINGASHIAFDLLHTEVRHAIMFRTVSPTIAQRSNVDGTQTDGGTLTFTQRLNPFVRLSLSGTSQYARVTSGQTAILSKRLQYVPEKSAQLAVDMLGHRISGGFSVSYLGQTYADDLNAQPLGAAIVAAAHLEVPLHGGLAVTFSAENLTGARYLSSIDRYGPPSMISVGLSLPIGKPSD